MPDYEVQTTLLNAEGNSLSAEMKTFYEKQLIETAQPALVLAVDGEIKSGNCDLAALRIRKAAQAVRFLRYQDSNFYARLLSKLNKWSLTE